MKKKDVLEVAKPILFNSEMVRAIMDGRKTVTRRCVKPQPKMRLCYIVAGSNVGKWEYPSESVWEIWGNEYKRPDNFSDDDNKCVWNPKYHTGDYLYVRETWCRIGTLNGRLDKYVYKASDKYPFGEEFILHFRWHPSIHMPKEAARIFLKVTDVRVERLKDITEEQAEKEGAKKSFDPFLDAEYITGFSLLWDSTINKSEQHLYRWDANPWVWVYEFERVEV